jgi:hypothetical protein
VVEGARARRAEPGLQLGEGHLDRVEVGTVRRQEAEAGADAFNRGLDARLLVQGEIVEDHDVAGTQRRDEHLFDVGEEGGIVQRPVEDGWRVEPITAQGGHYGLGLPMPARRVVAQPYPARTASIPAEEIRGDARFVDEDVARGVVQRQRGAPAAPGGRDIRPALFIGVNGFFLA